MAALLNSVTAASWLQIRAAQKFDAAIWLMNNAGALPSDSIEIWREGFVGQQVVCSGTVAVWSLGPALTDYAGDATWAARDVEMNARKKAVPKDGLSGDLVDRALPCHAEHCPALPLPVPLSRRQSRGNPTAAVAECK